ncbi:MAG: radical SAM protein [Deltaproteobacteria bacterium]|nr:MAG: radical SAM protein [Deltaproteobacteria bacterium]
MRVLFLFPNFGCPVGMSVGVAILSGALRRDGHDTRVLHISEHVDYPFDLARIVADARAYAPDLVAISLTTNHWPEMRETAAALKLALGRPIVAGGVHATLNAAAVMAECPAIDYLNVGDGEESLPALVRALARGEAPDGLPNIWLRRDGRVVEAPMRLADITTVPWMDLAGWPGFEEVLASRRGWVNVYMNRGCPYRCSYCHNNGVGALLEREAGRRGSNRALGYLRLRAVDDMIGELAAIRDRWDVSAFSFNDDTFTMDRAHTRAFLARYKAEIGLPWVCNTTVLDVDRELLAEMKDAGCDLVRFGVEAASRRIRRDVLLRDFSTEKTEAVFDACRALGLRSFAYNITANPSETLDDMRETLRLNARLRPNGIRISLGYPYPGTAYHREAERLGVLRDDAHANNYLWESPLAWSREEKLWIDKMRHVYWWWVNAALESEAAPHYAALVAELEALPADAWLAPGTRERLRQHDAELSAAMTRAGIAHYEIPFPDRPDIAILVEGTATLEREVLDPHDEASAR